MISDEIIKVLDNLGEKFGIFIDWSNENITPYLLNLVQRIKTYNIAESVYWICIGIVLFIIVAFLLKKLIKWNNSDEYVDDWLYASVFAFLLIFFVLGPIFFFGGISDLIESIYLPEKAILEMIKRSLRR